VLLAFNQDSELQNVLLSRIIESLPQQTDPLRVCEDIFTVLMAFTSKKNNKQAIDAELRSAVAAALEELDARFPLSDNIKAVSGRLARLTGDPRH